MLPPLFAVFAWPVIGATLFGRLRMPLAILVTILGGYLLLPERIALDLPLLPSLDKYTIPALAALVLSMAVAPRPGDDPVLPGLWSRLPLGRLLMAVLLIGGFATVATNGDALVYGAKVLGGLRPYDAFSSVLTLAMTLLPAVLARRYLSTPESHRLLLAVLCVAGLAYSLLALVEIRLSPQLNRWVYGFFPHDWRQHVRGDGYRPLVFLSHGLILAIFFCMAILAALGLSRVDRPRRGLLLGAGLWLLATLVLSRSLGALAIVIAMIPAVLFLSVRMQLMVAAVVATVFLTYPILRGAQLVPLETITALANDISPERAYSLDYRFDHEEKILEKARQRPLLGWGGWGRWRVFDEEGRDVTVSDGYWVIVIGVGGWVRYISEFGLLTAPIFLMLWGARRREIGFETSTLALILAANLSDSLPNASVSPVTWLVVGALWGRLEFAPARAAAPGSAATSPSSPAPARGPAALARHREAVYTRPRPAAAPSPAAADADARAPANAYTRQTERIVRPGSPARR